MNDIYSVPTIEARFTGKKSGCLIIIHRYDVNDYSALWTTEEHANDETYGYSVRGRLIDILEELEEEL